MTVVGQVQPVSGAVNTHRNMMPLQNSGDINYGRISVISYREKRLLH